MHLRCSILYHLYHDAKSLRQNQYVFPKEHLRIGLMGRDHIFHQYKQVSHLIERLQLQLFSNILKIQKVVKNNNKE